MYEVRNEKKMLIVGVYLESRCSLSAMPSIKIQSISSVSSEDPVSASSDGREGSSSLPAEVFVLAYHLTSSILYLCVYLLDHWLCCIIDIIRCMCQQGLGLLLKYRTFPIEPSR